MTLSKLEHLLLSMLCNGREPLHALYSDATKREADLLPEELVDALANLINIGYTRCYFYNEMHQKYEQRVGVTISALRKHLRSRPPEELRSWPTETVGGEYFFELTQAGLTEEQDKAYAHYYADREMDDR
jgi:hypothetical protein